MDPVLLASFFVPPLMIGVSVVLINRLCDVRRPSVTICRHIRDVTSVVGHLHNTFVELHLRKEKITVGKTNLRFFCHRFPDPVFFLFSQPLPSRRVYETPTIVISKRAKISSRTSPRMSRIHLRTIQAYTIMRRERERTR